MGETIKVENLSKSYSGTRAFSNVNISVSRGEVFGLLGENGAGKSSLIECMVGTKKADSGLVSILGMDPSLNRKKLFEKVGVQFQETSYRDKITVIELCEITQSLYKSALDYDQLLQQFNLTDKKRSYVSELSGGQKQRLSIVLALIPNPEVVFLDELTTGLDARSRREVWKYLHQLKAKGLTIFLVSHFMDEVDVLCDKIMILKQGQIAFQGSTKEAIVSSPFENLEDAYLWYTGEEVTLNENL